MKNKAILMALAMMTTALAGCTGTDGVTEVDEDALNELIQNNLQDFINNTTVVVNQDFHYHNNTTVVNNDYDSTNQYNNTTNVDGGEVNNYNSDNSNTNYTMGGGDGSGSITQVFRTVWSTDGAYERTNFGERPFLIDGIVQAPVSEYNEVYNRTLVYTHNGVTFGLSFTCEEYANAYERMDNHDYWRDWIYDAYGGDYNNANSLSYTVHSDIQSVERIADEGYCWDDDLRYSTYDLHQIEVFEISLEEGQAIQFLSLPNLHEVTLECADGYMSSSNNGTHNNNFMLGGHSDCTVRGYSQVSLLSVYNSTPISNGSGPSLQVPDWFSGSSWYVYSEYPEDYHYNWNTTPLDFLVYFVMNFVEVHDQGTE